MSESATLDATDRTDLQRLLDESAIRELVVVFADAATFRPERLAGMWLPDATFANPADGVHLDGADQVVAGLMRLRRQWTSFLHDEHSVGVEVAGDQATGRTRCVQVTRSFATGARVTFATFDDEYARHDGRWVFAARTYTVLDVLAQPSLPAQAEQGGVVAPAATAHPVRGAAADSPFRWQQLAGSP